MQTMSRQSIPHVPGYVSWDDVYDEFIFFGPRYHHDDTTREEMSDLAQRYYAQLIEAGGAFAELATISLHDAIPQRFSADPNPTVTLGIGDAERGYQLVTLTYRDGDVNDPAGVLQPTKHHWEWVHDEVTSHTDGYIHRIAATQYIPRRWPWSHGTSRWAWATVTLSDLTLTVQSCTAHEAGWH